MDLGDIIRLIFFGIIFLSFFGGFFGRKSDEEKKAQPRPTDISQSGGESRSPRPQAVAPQREPAAHEQRWEAETLDDPHRHKEEVRERYGSSSTETWRETLRERYGESLEASATRAGEEKMLEQDLTDMPPVENLNPEHRSRQAAVPQQRRRRRRTDAAILRGWLNDPDTLVNAFIVKEVLDKPVGMRDSR